MPGHRPAGVQGNLENLQIRCLGDDFCLSDVVIALPRPACRSLSYCLFTVTDAPFKLYCSCLRLGIGRKDGLVLVAWLRFSVANGICGSANPSKLADRAGQRFDSERAFRSHERVSPTPSAGRSPHTASQRKSRWPGPGLRARAPERRGSATYLPLSGRFGRSEVIDSWIQPCISGEQTDDTDRVKMR